MARWVLVLIARPYTWWRITLVAAMAAGFLLVLAVPWARTFFSLRPYHPATDLVALVIAACAAAALTVYLSAARLPDR
jgi:cation-transporting ATPase E